MGDIQPASVDARGFPSYARFACTPKSKQPLHAANVRLSDGGRNAFDAVHRLTGTPRGVRPAAHGVAVLWKIPVRLSDVAAFPERSVPMEANGGRLGRSQLVPSLD